MVDFNMPRAPSIKPILWKRPSRDAHAQPVTGTLRDNNEKPSRLLLLLLMMMMIFYSLFG